VRFGNALGTWLRFFTEKPEILLKWGHWEYNQTWGPTHFNVMNSRDALATKLFVALAIAGAGTRYEADAKAFLDFLRSAKARTAFEKQGFTVLVKSATGT